MAALFFVNKGFLFELPQNRNTTTFSSLSFIIPIQIWQSRTAEHLRVVSPWADAYVQRRSYGHKHPVEDFLFTYYSFSPSKLKRWVPALGEVLQVDPASIQSYPELPGKETLQLDDTLQLDPAQLPAATLRAAQFIGNLSSAILQRAPRFRCFGLHEWAMVYQQSAEQVRHQGYELRLSQQELAKFVQTQPVVCSHYDAFRFFTPEARSLNTLQPQLETRVQLEQGGCLHANMDLYKWAYKLWPWCGSDLVGAAFVLAQKGRQIDMRASPYELQHLGYSPIRIETSDGREEYEHEQRLLAEAAQPLRLLILQIAQKILQSQR